MKNSLAKLLFVVAAVAMLGALPAQAASNLSGDLEIFSWWAGDEGPALEALIDIYKKENPNVNVINATVTGGSGVNAKSVLKTRMLGGNPPDSFQVHAGQELIGTWVKADRMEDLTPIFKANGWMEAFPKGLIKLIGTDKGIWSVPVNIHRSNVMWFVPANLKKWGVEAPKTWDEFFTVAETLKAKGVVPLALAQNWTANHLWESVALAALGADKWDALWSGDLAFDSADGVKVWELFGKVLKYTNSDATSLSWQQATDMVVDGRAAFNVMGDWAAGYMATTKKLAPGSGFAWSASPDTTGEFMFLADSFGLPKGAPHRDNAVAWLKVLGSLEGSDTFNPIKGSISARLDSDLSKYNAYGQSAAADFGKDRIVGSLAHGVTANEGFMNDFASVMEMFLKSRNAQAAAKASQQIAVKNGIAK
ncbi:ABC transporter substrate-binding protein [Pseudodesulfovibrio senegalensis]|jgi:glucose/mannose transport system substrate-binding protein|uniref:Probable sugar-binding periplasmic protein n=1 Tax=Pseudodesulfovibrio senegalensis TaxID=1721087 RepID=A0A6N6N593_9BACT|nr:ABC transporter substrate-binding protein [Pseudodesulfovibrio senegalensis]KAB1443224.1 carbohydrate ABC transporter substrate-binding protein [Pseudodesulfovibrio senegalensis]